MAEELTYALITPYSLHKSRTGGIISRLLSLCPLEFVGARMYAFSDELVDAYRETLALEDKPDDIRDALQDYVDHQLRASNSFGISNRAMLLVFRGENAVRQLREATVGPISDVVTGDTVRGTYGDVTRRGEGGFAFFEPAVLAPTTLAANDAQLRLLARYSESDGGILTDVLKFDPGKNVQTTLVLIKPDNFARRTARPGNIIDAFSRTGLFIVGAKLMRMTVPMAEKFYGPLRGLFVDKLKKIVRAGLGEAITEAVEFPVTAEQLDAVADIFKDANAECEYRKIVNYMTGREGDASRDAADGGAPCMALLYQGEDAIGAIRDRLGATNPEDAAEGTVRCSYGHDLMKNGAHASDSPENAERERGIIGLWQEGGHSDIRTIIEAYFGESVGEPG